MVDAPEMSAGVKSLLYIPRIKGAIVSSLVFTIALFLVVLTGMWDSFADRMFGFFPLLIGLFVLFVHPVVETKSATLLSRLAAWLTRRGAFVSNPEQEAPKFALIRIAFGLFLIERAFWIVAYLVPSDWGQPSVWLPAMAGLLCGVLVMLGLLTQYVLVYLIVFQWQMGDMLLGTYTLGNWIAAMLSVLLIFANAGANFSLDRLLLKRGTFAGKAISAFYYDNRLPSESGLQIAKLITLACYWCVCLYSLFVHLGEPAWMSGSAGPLLLTNNFMSRYSSEFSWLLSQGPIPVFLARVSLWAMLPWYLLLLPFVLLGGWFRTYVIVWAVLFFALSLFILQLGWLAQFEFLLLAGLFWTETFISGANRLQVAYDDRCNLCDRTVTFVKAVDLFRRVQLKPLSKNIPWLLELGIDPDDAQKDLYAVDASNGKAVKGYEFYVLLSKHVLLLLPLHPLLIIGRYLGGPAIYRFVAERRTRMFGVCQIPTAKPEYALLQAGQMVRKDIGPGDPISTVFCHVGALLICFVISLPVSYLVEKPPTILHEIQRFVAAPTNAAILYGVGPINVFNSTDLRMAENWFTISKRTKYGLEQLLPIFSEDGKRLAAHRSDRVYFGRTAMFRRGVIGKDGCQFEAFGWVITYVVESEHLNGDTLVYRQYAEPLPGLDLLLRGQYMASERRLVCEVTF
jgi:predicted DCC family thiol-disulfide oxidoreductase YuxK